AATDRRADLGYRQRLLSRLGVLLAWHMWLLLGVDAIAPAEDFAHLLAAPRGDGTRAHDMGQRLEGRLDHVVRVGGADRIGDHILDTEGFEDGAHRTASNNPGAL